MFDKKWLLAILSPVIFLLLCEIVLRLFGLPEGTFSALIPGTRGVYPENAKFEMNWGVVPYWVKTNSLGLRGREIDEEKPEGTLRILTIGDSVTDGFYVDNEATWQYVLEDRLTGAFNRPVEVINGAAGGGSIDKELLLLREFQPQLDPDIVILTFVTNDVAEMRGRTLASVLNGRMVRSTLTLEQQISKRLFQTALGEFGFDLYLTASSESYRQKKQRDEEDHRFENRYAIAGGTNFRANADDFLKRYGPGDGLVLGPSFTPEIEKAFGLYMEALKVFAQLCREQGAELLCVYFPAYPQIYRAESPNYINARMAAAVAPIDMHYLDATNGFRDRGRGQVLHLAPLDYHLNPAGNRVFAEIIAGYIADHLR